MCSSFYFLFNLLSFSDKKEYFLLIATPEAERTDKTFYNNCGYFFLSQYCEQSRDNL